jgi:PAS domain S-box-containing protein
MSQRQSWWRVGAVVVPIAVAGLALVGRLRGLYGSATALALLAFAAALLPSFLLRVQADRLRRARELADSLFRLAPDAVLLVAPDGRVQRMNDQAVALLGWTPEELLGQPVEMLVPPEVRHAHVAHRAAFAVEPSRRAMGHGRELAVLRRDGSRLMADISLGPVPGPGGVSTLVAVRDVSEQRLARRELQRRLQEVEDLNQELEAFSYSVSHDLRAPLRAVDGFARILEEDHAAELAGEPRRLLGVIRGQARFMRGLVDDLLRLSRFSRQPLEVERVDMAALARRAAAGLHPADDAELEWGPLPPASGDPRLLQQVWTNYLDNALKFSAAGRPLRLRIEGRESAGEVVYAVEDNGVGFDPADAGRLFTVFQRLHPEHRFSGSGIGLALVQRIVHRHGGRVWAEGRPGAGATFYFSLPAGAGAVQAEPAPEEGLP